MLLLVRHGESQANAEGRLSGRAETPLTDRGRAQAAALAGRLAGAGRLITSPLRRAGDTAAALGLTVAAEVDQRWTEIDYGAFEGARLSDLDPDTWRRWRADPDFRPPGGETLREVSVRVAAACDELFATAGEAARGPADVVVVSHVSPIKAAVAWALGAGAELAWRLQLSTASITAVDGGPDGPVLRAFNLSAADWPPRRR